jgi:hypothetical protein
VWSIRVWLKVASIVPHNQIHARLRKFVRTSIADLHSLPLNFTSSGVAEFSSLDKGGADDRLLMLR